MPRFFKQTFAFFFFTLSAAWAQPDNYHQLAREGIALGLNLQIDQAEAIFNGMIALEPNHPLGYLALALTSLYGHQFEEDQKAFERKFQDNTEKAMKLARKNLSGDSKSVEALFYLGVGHVFWGFYHGERGNWLRALWYGKQGIDGLEQVIAIDSSYCDAYLGIGAFHYYADSRRVASLVKNGAALPGYKGDRKKGLRELQLAAEKGKYAASVTSFLLGYINLHEEGEDEKALDPFESLAQQYPANPFFTLKLAVTLRKLGKHGRAVEIAQNVVAQKSDHRTLMFHVQAHDLLGDLCFDLNQFETAIAHYQRALETAAQVAGKINRLVAWTNFNLGHSYEMAGQREEATRYYRRVKNDGAKDAYQIAKKHLEKPHLPVEEQIIRGQNYFRTKNYAHALKVFEAAYAKALENTADYPGREIPGLLDSIGQVQFEKKNYAAAIATFTKILALKNIEEKGAVPWAHLNLGNCYNEMGDRQKAEAEYEIASQYDGGALRLRSRRRGRSMTAKFRKSKNEKKGRQLVKVMESLKTANF